MRYEFSKQQLEVIHTMIVTKKTNPRDAFKFYMNMSSKDSVFAEDVEDFVVAFRSAYKKKFGNNR